MQIALVNFDGGSFFQDCTAEDAARAPSPATFSYFQSSPFPWADSSAPPPLPNNTTAPSTGVPQTSSMLRASAPPFEILASSDGRDRCAHSTRHTRCSLPSRSAAASMIQHLYQPPLNYNPYLGIPIVPQSGLLNPADAKAINKINSKDDSPAGSPPSSSSSSPSPNFSQMSNAAPQANGKPTLKDFIRDLKSKEHQSFEEAEQLAVQYEKLLPEATHWKIYLEMADVAKRDNRLSRSRKYFKRVIQLQPTCAQAWLEYAKMEEEAGKLEKTLKLLASGLDFSPHNDGLLVKAIKLQERMGNLEEARAYLGRLKNVSIEKSWKVILEGALLEARAGNLLTSRRIFKYLIDSMPWNGPVYQEACHLEEKYEEYARAIEIVEKGLQENPRYGPLWFSALRLYERTSSAEMLSTRATVERAMKHISKELTWKLYFEAAQAEERAKNASVSRAAYVEAVRNCPENLLWKVWLGAARTELNANNTATARKLLQRSLEEVPPKNRALVVLECARLEEYAGNTDRARKILAKARKETKQEWRVFLESVLLEMRAGDVTAAVREAQEALAIHPGNGRLWAVLIQLKRREGPAEQWAVFNLALKEVPKSGEVWCEGARICVAQRNYKEARRYLDFAVQFTPQYGDSFVEYILLEILDGGDPTHVDTRRLELQCLNAEPNYGTVWLYCKRHPLDSTRQILRVAKNTFVQEKIWAKEGAHESELSIERIFAGFVAARSNDAERRKAIYSFDPIKP